MEPAALSTEAAGLFVWIRRFRGLPTPQARQRPSGEGRTASVAEPGNLPPHASNGKPYLGSCRSAPRRRLWGYICSWSAPRLLRMPTNSRTFRQFAKACVQYNAGMYYTPGQFLILSRKSRTRFSTVSLDTFNSHDAIAYSSSI